MTQRTMHATATHPRRRHQNTTHATTSSSSTTTTIHHHNHQEDGSIPRPPIVGLLLGSVRRRGAAVHSELLKSAFEASMDFSDSGDDRDMRHDMIEEESCLQHSFRSDSTTGDDDGGPPRKRRRSLDKRGTTLGNMLEHMVLQSYCTTNSPSDEESWQELTITEAII
jgi:hypothetical protein